MFFLRQQIFMDALDGLQSVFMLGQILGLCWVIFTSAFSQCFLLYQILVFVHAALALAGPFSVVLHIHMFLHAVRLLYRG